MFQLQNVLQSQSYYKFSFDYVVSCVHTIYYPSNSVHVKDTEKLIKWLNTYEEE